MTTQRVLDFKKTYIETRPSISVQRAKIFTSSHKETEGEAVIIRRAKAFRDVCRNIDISIFDGELLVGSIGEFRRSGIICPEYSWQWVDEEMDNFANRTQDQYNISDSDKKVLREEIFPYWQGKSLEETFLARLDKETAKVLVDTGIVDNDSTWRSAVGEITADYTDLVFQKGFGGFKQEAEAKLAELEPTTPENIEKIEFYTAAAIVAEGIITLAHRYGAKATELADACEDKARKAELLEIAAVCQNVPEKPPTNFREAIQCVWFTQLGSILSVNSLALNLGRIDQ